MKKTTQLVLVRHAETTMITENRLHGHLDAPLSEKGLRDTRKTAEHFREQSFDALYASSLGRAVLTAEIIGEAIELNPIILDGLRERYYGWLEGKSLDIFEPDLTGAFWMRPFVRLALFASGEHENHFVKRVVRTIEEISDKHKGQRLMLVLHWGTLSILTKYFLGESLKNWQSVGPWTACGISEFHTNGKGWKTVRLDDTNHL